MTLKHRMAVLLLLPFLASAAVQAALGAQIPGELVGAWREESGTSLLRTERDRILHWDSNRLTVKSVLDYTPGSVTVRNAGVKEIWLITRTGNQLRVEHEGQGRTYQLLDSTPAELWLEPLSLGTGKIISSDKIQSIRKELAERVRQDQEVRLNPEKASKRAEVDAENTRYLRELVQEVGWIDVARFDKTASHHAFLLVQHSGDLPLMMAVLPLVEKDFKGTEHAQDYALLFDRLQLKLGYRQRYGTQIGEDKDGNPFIKPMEDPDHVEERWKELGLSPFSEYLSDASRILYGGKPIRLPKADE